MTKKIFCPCCGKELPDVGEPEAGRDGHYATLGPEMRLEEVVGYTLSWDCLCRSCGFSLVMQSDLPAHKCPLSKETAPQVAGRVAERIAAET